MPVPRGRRRNAPRVHLQPRDKNAFLILHYCDGLMSEEQLVRYCYANTHEKNASGRLLALFDNSYLSRNSDPEKWAQYPHLVYWLAGKGYDVVYSILEEQGVEVKHNTRNIHVSAWRPLTLDHHLQVNDIFLKVLVDLEGYPQLSMRAWVGQAYFRSSQWKGQKPWHGKVIIPNKNGKTEAKLVEPDGFFKILRWLDEEKKSLQVHGFTLEVDRSTETQQPISQDKKVSIDEKLKKGAALVDSPPYRHAFGLNTGRCLMVTTSWERAEKMLELAQEAGAAWAWYFTTHATATDPATNILTDEIWRKADRPQLVRLIAV